MKALESKVQMDRESEHFGCYPAAGRRGPIATTALVELSLEAYYRFSHLLRANV